MQSSCVANIAMKPVFNTTLTLIFASLGGDPSNQSEVGSNPGKQASLGSGEEAKPVGVKFVKCQANSKNN